MARATAIAIEEHRRLGIPPIAVSRNGQVVIIPPEEIEPMADYEDVMGRRRSV